MTERQGRLVSKIQGYEGKDQKTSQSLSSVCSWYLGEKVKLQKDEKKADDGWHKQLLSRTMTEQ